MEIQAEFDGTNMIQYSDTIKVSQYFIPKLWIKWFGKDKIIKMRTLLGQTVFIEQKNLKKLNFKMDKVWYGKSFIKVMVYNKPYRESRRIPLYDISKKLKKQVGRLSVNVEKECRARK